MTPRLVIMSAPTISLATFTVDVTPPLGSPVAYAPARSITDPLSARGLVLLGAGAPIVLCAVDWIGVYRSGRDRWRAALADAVGTTPDRVAIQSLHQHDAPRWDARGEELLASQGLGAQCFDTSYAEDVIARTASAARDAVPSARPVTELGLGSAVVDRIASNRRILGPDGTVAIVRFSKCSDPAGIAAPEGLIDPELTMISFWDGDEPLAVVTSYACHPQSYYGQGDVTAEWVGLARRNREEAVPGPLHLHLTGAAGDVAAAKYNDGTPPRRPELAGRLADAMAAAWQATVRQPLGHVAWRTVEAGLPLARHLDPAVLQGVLADPAAVRTERIRSAVKLALLEESVDGHYPVDVAALHLDDARLVLLPGEPFVAYQLAARAAHDGLVMVSGYGDYSPGYIGTEVAYGQGGYETEPSSSSVAPEVEGVLLAAIREVLAPA